MVYIYLDLLNHISIPERETLDDFLIEDENISITVASIQTIIRICFNELCHHI